MIMTITTRLSSGYTTVIPASLRKGLELEPGDTLEWEAKADALVVKRRRKVKLEDIIGIGSWDGDAVEDHDRMYDEQW